MVRLLRYCEGVRRPKQSLLLLLFFIIYGLSTMDYGLVYAGQLLFDGVPVDITTADNEDLVITPGTGGNTQIGDASSTNSNATSNDDLHITGKLEVDGAAYLDSGVTLGDSTSDTITATGYFGSHLIPSTDSTYNLGSSSLAWRYIYADTISGYNAALALNPASGYSLTTSVTKNTATGNEVAYDLAAAINKATSGNYTGLKLNVTETSAPGADDRLFDLQVGGTSMFRVDNSGNVTAAGTITGAAGGFAPTDATYVTLSTNGTLSAERVLTGTSNQITVADGGAGGNVTLSTPQDIATTSAVTFATVNTGQGANELYDMDQNVDTASTPQFARLGVGAAADATNILTTTSSSTTANSKAINVSHTGVITGTGYAGYFSKTGASTTNVGLYATASGATTNNYAAIFDGGSVGIGDTTPDGKLDFDFSSTSTTAGNEYGANFTTSDTGVVTTGTDETYGQYISTTRTGATGGTINTYGLYSTITGDAAGAGTSTTYGIYSSATGGDTVYSGYFTGAPVAITDGTFTNNNATANGELYVDGDLEVDGTIYGTVSGGSALTGTTADTFTINSDNTAAVTATLTFGGATTGTGRIDTTVGDIYLVPAGNDVIVDATGTSKLTIDRSATTDYGLLSYSTNNSSAWDIGPRNTGNEDFQIYNLGTPNAAAIYIQASNNNVGIDETSPGARLEVNPDDTDNAIGIIVDQDDVTNNPVALQVENAGTGNGIFVNQDGNGISINVDSESTTADLLALDGSTLTTGNLIQGTVTDTLNTDTALINVTGTALNTATNVTLYELSTTAANDVDVTAVKLERGANDARIVFDEGDDVWKLDQGAGSGLVNIATGGSAAPTDATYVTLSTNATLSAERVLTGTSNQITVTDGGANGNVTLSTPQDIATTSTPQFTRLGLGAAADATNILTATSASTTDLSKAANITHTGVITGTGYAGYFSTTGISTTNVGLYATASGATNNYAAIFESGLVGIGTTAPEFRLTLDKGATTPDGGILAIGTYGSGNALSTSGAGTRLIWYPRKAAFLVGYGEGTEWDDANIGAYAIVMGREGKATGSDAIAIGRNCHATGAPSTAIGYASSATGSASMALAYAGTASGNYSLALGDSITASGADSVAIGTYVTAGTATGSMVIGYGAGAGANNLTNNIVKSLMVGFDSTVPTLYVGPSSGAGTYGSVGIGTTTPSGSTTAGTCILALKDDTAPVGGRDLMAMFYADTVVATTEMFVMDEAGNATQISPHDPETGEWIFYSKNTKTGRVVKVNMEQLVKAVEEVTGKKFMFESVEEVKEN